MPIPTTRSPATSTVRAPWTIAPEVAHYLLLLALGDRGRAAPLFPPSLCSPDHRRVLTRSHAPPRPPVGAARRPAARLVPSSRGIAFRLLGDRARVGRGPVVLAAAVVLAAGALDVRLLRLALPTAGAYLLLAAGAPAAPPRGPHATRATSPTGSTSTRSRCSRSCYHVLGSWSSVRGRSPRSRSRAHPAARARELALRGTSPSFGCGRGPPRSPPPASLPAPPLIPPARGSGVAYASRVRPPPLLVLVLLGAGGSAASGEGLTGEQRVDAIVARTGVRGGGPGVAVAVVQRPRACGSRRGTASPTSRTAPRSRPPRPSKLRVRLEAAHWRRRAPARAAGEDPRRGRRAEVPA